MKYKCTCMKYFKFYCLVIFYFILISSCKTDRKEAFAFGNFETEDVIISSENTGKILSLSVQEGSKIKKDQVLAEIDSLQLTLKKKQLIAARKAVLTKVLQIEKQINVSEVTLTNLEKEIRRFTELMKEGAATEKQTDDLQAQKEQIEAQIEALKAQKSSVYAEADTYSVQIEQVNDQISRCRISSPMDGVLLEKYAREGEIAVAGRSLLKIADLSNMILRVFVDGDQLSEIRTGANVKVGFDGPDGEIRSLNGEVMWISDQAEFTPKIIQTREERVNLVYAVKVLVPNDGSLKAGMPGEILNLN